jgi:hypothetical protein
MKQLIIFLILLSCHIRIDAQDNRQDSTLTKNKKTEVDTNPYSTFRNLAFSVKTSDLQLNLQPDKTVVYGVIMDWDLEKTVVTVVAYSTGDASVYTGSGQMFIGGYAHKPIKEAAIDFVNSAQSFLKDAEIASDDSLPDKGCVKFYFKTNIGTFVHQESEQIGRAHV